MLVPRISKSARTLSMQSTVTAYRLPLDSMETIRINEDNVSMDMYLQNVENERHIFACHYGIDALIEPWPQAEERWIDHEGEYHRSCATSH